jgi:hypothetical protein
VVGSPASGVLDAGLSSPKEKRETFFFGGSGVGDGCAAVLVFCTAAALGVAVPPNAPSPAFFFFFLFVFRDTERGLNINGFPTSSTSSAAFCPAGIVGPEEFEV